MANIREKWREFCEWQKRPHEVAPMSEEWHECNTCATAYQGNYCPRCGQSATIGRYSFKKALLLFLDVWGLGNRGMFRTLRDLILRPGYMIRDYLQGMQMAYFPPFKLFFLLTALSMVVQSGFNLKGQNYFELSRQQVKQSVAIERTSADKQETSAEEQYFSGKAEHYGMMVIEYIQRFPNLMTLAILVVLSGLLYLCFRKSPNIPDLRYSEMLVALVYSSNMLSIYQILTEFLCLGMVVQYVTQLLPIIPLKQMTGFSWWRTILSVLVVLLCAYLTLVLAFAVLTVVFMPTAG